MTLATNSPNLGVLVSGAPGDQHFLELLRQWRALDALVQPSVISRIAAVPASGAADGDRYLLTAEPNSAKIARYSADANSVTGWEYYSPKAGWRVHVVSEGADYRFVEGAWTLAAAGGTGMTNPMTAANQMIVGGADGVPSALAAPVTAGFVLTFLAGSIQWAAAAGGGAVSSVAGRTGDIVLTKSDVGLPNVDNTSDASKPVSSLQQAALNQKVDKVAGKVLSTNDFTDAERSKLAGLEGSHFKGEFLSLAALQVAIPAGSAGDYARVDAGVGADVDTALWDSTDQKWVMRASGGGSMTPAEIKQAYESNPNTNAFADAQRDKLALIAPGATANSPDAQLRDRATHTGTQLASTISDFDSSVLATVLADLSTFNQAILPGDSVHQALGKAQGQADALKTGKLGVSDAAADSQKLGGHPASDFEKSLVPGGNITIDRSNPYAPVISAVTGGGNVVTSVNARTGAVTLTSADVGLPNANNTSDANKPVSSAQQAALNLKVDRVTGKGLSTEDYATADKTKLAGVAEGATANATNAQLRDRSTHTGTQLVSTLSNLVGPVAQSGGLPTGSVIEYGVNANGSFLKLADGTMVCWRSGSLTIACAIGAIAASITYPFPATFVGQWASFYSGHVTDNSVSMYSIGMFDYAMATNVTGWRFTIRNTGGAAITQILGASMIAIGRWV